MYKMGQNDSLNITARLTIKIRQNYSLQHIYSAALFTRQAYLFEKAYDGKYSEELFSDHRSYASQAIIATASFLEATINELFSDVIDNPESEQVKQLDTNIKQLMAESWRRGVPKTAKHEIIEKYQIALELAGKQKFELGKLPVFDHLDGCHLDHQKGATFLCQIN